MHSDEAAVQASVRKYFTVGAVLLVFTAITVAASYFNLGVGLGIAVALTIAALKGSMVASIFMHLSHEKQWIYGALLLTVVGFLILLIVPIATLSDEIGTPIHHAAGERAGH